MTISENGPVSPVGLPNPTEPPSAADGGYPWYTYRRRRVGPPRRIAPYPEAQASFFVVRRDVHARRDVRPWVYHGDPAHWMQQSIWEAGLTVVDFPSNHGGHILHRGRAGVAAAAEFSPRHSYAKVDRRAPHFMGVPGGAEAWAAIEGRHERLLRVENEPELVDRLAAELERLGTGA